MDESRRQFLQEDISKLVTRMAIPSVAMQIVTLIYNTVDTYFIGQISKSAAAAIGAVFAVQAVIQAIGFGFGMGVSSLCSRRLGAAANEEANTYAMSGIVGAGVVAGIISILGLLMMTPLLSMIGCTETMLEYARPYAVVVLIFAPFVCVRKRQDSCQT